MTKRLIEEQYLWILQAQPKELYGGHFFLSTVTKCNRLIPQLRHAKRRAGTVCHTQPRCQPFGFRIAAPVRALIMVDAVETGFG